MRRKLLSTLRTSVAVLFIALQLPLVSVFALAASAEEICNSENSANSNNECYWESAPRSYGSCTKDTNVSGKTYTLPAAPAGQAYSMLVVNGGSNDAQYANPVAGTPYSAPANGGGNTPNVSHAIYCTKTTTPPPPVDVCKNLPDNQATVPAGYVQNGENCDLLPPPPVDVCKNLPDNQATVPAGYMQTGENCYLIPPPPVDVCKNLPDNQATVPAGYVQNGENCDLLPPPPVDVCKNLPDNQATVPAGYMQTGENCYLIPPPPVDVCLNIPGNQATLPKGIVQQNDKMCKVEICHRDSNVKQPYGPKKIEVAVDAIDGEGNNDHDGHTGPVFNSSMTKDDMWGDIIPPVPGLNPDGLNWTTAGEAIFDADCQVPPQECPEVGGIISLLSTSNEEECPVDQCPNLPEFQSEVPSGYMKNRKGDCVKDKCPNLQGFQWKVPHGYMVNYEGDCVPDKCPNLPGFQWSVPEGYVKHYGKCIKDKCPNVEGLQWKVPHDMVKDEEGNCVPRCPTTDEEETPVLSLTQSNEQPYNHEHEQEECPKDVCPNVEGNQNNVPEGMTQDEQGNCVKDVCPNIEGVQTKVPEGMGQDTQGNCFTPGRGSGETVTEIITVTAKAPTPPTPGRGAAAEELVNTGSNALLSLFVGMTIFGLTAGIAFATPRRRYS